MLKGTGVNANNTPDRIFERYKSVMMLSTNLGDSGMEGGLSHSFFYPGITPGFYPGMPGCPEPFSKKTRVLKTRVCQ